jgi:hypothetical protein
MQGLILTESLTVGALSPSTRQRLVERVHHYQPSFYNGHYPRPEFLGGVQL